MNVAGQRAWAQPAPAMVLLLVVLAACERRRFVRPLSVEQRREWSSPAERDTGRMCADMGELRACFGADPSLDGKTDEFAGVHCKNQVCLVPRPIPVPVVSARGWRCVGGGPERRCFDRGRASGPFACEKGRCIQAEPLLPDSGEWICADAAGAALCAGSEPAAGLPEGPIEPGWQCGVRRGGAAPRRVCLDLAPDFPDGRPSGWRCHYEQEHGANRICERDPAAHVLGDACDAAHPCVDGARCIAGRCLPLGAEPNCWLDLDCASKACRFGACVEAPT